MSLEQANFYSALQHAPHLHPVCHIVSIFCIISSFALASAEALTHGVCVGKDTKAAAAPEELATDADESEATEEAGPSSKDLAKDTPVGESHGCWCVWSSDLVLLRQRFYCWTVWLGLSLALCGKIQHRLCSLRLAMQIISCGSFHAHTAPFKTVACFRHSTL